MPQRMYGVVLWADACDSKAVIWCEDQGNLAYYSAADPTIHEGVSLDAGDLIQFELLEHAQMRRARNPERVHAGLAPGLAQSLRESSSKPTRRSKNNVIAFPTPALDARAC